MGLETEIQGPYLTGPLSLSFFCTQGSLKPRTNDNKAKGRRLGRGRGTKDMPPFLLPGESTISVAVEKVTEQKEQKVLMTDLQVSHLQGHVVGENPSRTVFP